MDQIYILWGQESTLDLAKIKAWSKMTKPLEQIQKENRKFILEATLQGNNLRLLKENIADFQGAKLTLSRVLLAFKNKEVKTCYRDEIIFNIAGSQFCGLSVEDEEIYATTYTLYGICLWNLELETLEEQTEETQRGINKLFND